MANETKGNVIGVVSAGAKTLEGVEVGLFSRAWRGEECIGTAVTDECGRYRIEYDAEESIAKGRKTLDLFIRTVHPKGEYEPFESPVVYRAKRSESINVSLSAAIRDDSEWERLESALSDLADIADAAAWTDDQAEYAAGTTGLPLHAVLHWRAAKALAAEDGALSAATYYGLLRGGLPERSDALGETSLEERELALDRSLRHGRIPAMDDQARSDALQRLEAAAEKTRQSVAARADELNGKGEELTERRRRLAASIGTQPAISVDGRIAGFGPSNAASNAMAESHLEAPQQDPALLKEKTMFPELDWEALLTEARRTGVFRNPARERLARFLEQAEDFDIEHTVIDRYFADRQAGIAAARSEAGRLEEADVLRLKAIQRVHQIAPQFEQMYELMGGGLDSAMSVASVGEAAFVDRFSTALGGEEEARLVFAQAEQIHATATQLYASAYQAMHDVNPAALGGSAAADRLRKDLPDWAALFGRIDMCDCADCKSVYGAAAYYVDLLQYLNPKTLPAGMTERPIDALRRHRPDLEHIKLTCENTNTVLPYIDLANEVLESFAARGIPAVNNTSADSAAEDLGVKREYSSSFTEDISDDAAFLVKRAVFPFGLPYDKPLNEARAYLKLVGTTLHELMAVFPERQPAYALAGEYLGLSSTERNIWMGRLERGLHEFYGYADETVISGGLLGEYFPNADLSGAPVIARVDPEIGFDWDDGPPLPTLPAKFSVRWTGSIVPKQSRTVKIHIDGSSRGYRLRLNGQLLFDQWDVEHPQVGITDPIVMEAGRAYSVVVEYLCGGSNGEWVYLGWEYEGAYQSRIPQEELRCAMPWSQHIARVPEFLSRTGLSYEVLLELLASRYVNPNGVTPNVTLLAQGDPCDLDHTWLGNLSFDNFAPLRDIHRFVRLLRKVGGSVRDLDRTLHALGRERDSFLVKLADMRRLRSLLGESRVSEVELHALWSTLDTNGPDALYLSLFQNRALMNPPDPDFALLSGRKEIRGYALPLATKKAQLLAVLRRKENEWSALLNAAKLSPDDAKLTLANLSLLFRHSLLSRLLGLGIVEFDALRALTGISPFQSPAETIRFAEAWQEIEESGALAGDLRYWFDGGELPDRTRHPSETSTLKLAAELREGYKRIRESASQGDQGETGVGALKRIFAIQTLAEALELTVPVLTELAEKTLRSIHPQSPEAALIADFLIEEEHDIGASFTRLHRAATLVRALDFDASDIEYVRLQGADFEGYDWNASSGASAPAGASFRQWRLLNRYASAKRMLLPGGSELPSLFQAAKQPGADLIAGLNRLADMTGWNAQELIALCGPEGWNLQPADFANPGRIPAIRDALRLGERIRIPIAKWVSWTEELPDAELAFEVKNAAKTLFDEASWRQRAADVENVLREQWRDALVQYVLRLPTIQANGIRDGNQLFEYFLIDVEMNAGMKTSRIKQAISSVQLFVQRCLMNLEPGVPPKAIDAKQWEWLKNYRTWEANRKIFLYPENWIEPELRDDKTPIFSDLESEILQKEITDENVKEAFSQYLSRLDDLARLDVRAMYRDGEDVHVFARTYSMPYVYYHRIKRPGSWTPWRKIDADIQGDHLVPYIFNSSLYLFWGVMEKGAEQKDNKPTSQQPSSSQERFMMKLAWSEFRGERWSAKRITDKGLFLQWILQNDELESARANYFLFPVILNAGGRRLLIFMVHKNFRLIGTGGKYKADICGRFVFDDTRKSTTILPASNSEASEFLAPLDMHMSGMQLQAESDIPLGIPRTANGTTPYQTVPILNHAQGTFRLTGAGMSYQNFAFNDNRIQLSLVHQDFYRTYYAEQDPYASEPPALRYEMLFHPMTRSFVQAGNQRGVEGLLTLDTQRMSNETSSQTIFSQLYAPTNNVTGTQPVENVDFAVQGAYATYNWELFFHIPMLLADRLTKERRYAEAIKWYHAVFNPTYDSAEEGVRKFWRFLPFYANMQENRIWKLLTELADPNGDPEVKEQLQHQIAQWRVNPFEPHRIARLRVGSYQKNVVMKYIETLVAWGDDLFARDTMEAINEATQLYVMAASLLGPRPERIPELTEAPARTYAQLAQAGLDDFSNALVDVQNKFPFIRVRPKVGSGGAPIGFGVGRALYFGIPKNDKLLGYWDTVEDRLQKIRSGLNLQGLARSLSLFEAPIDPAMAVLAARSGAGAGSIIADAGNRPLGHYRFAAVLPQALELCSEAKSLGAALLVALEKKDAEELGSLRAGHETSLLRLIRQTKVNQIDEARLSLDGLNKSRAIADYRFSHYKNMIASGLNAFELGQLVLLGGSAALQGIAGVAELASSIGHAAPDLTVGAAGWASSPLAVANYGGSNVGRASDSFGKAMGTLASILGTAASMSGIVGEQKRRADEWKLQVETASRELSQIDAQIAAAEVRLSIAERELANHDRQIAQAEETERFLKDKYTNRELYQWLANQLTTLYFQTYQLAYNTARGAEAAYRFERGLSESSYITFGYWDSLRKGLLAGERLYLDLKRLSLAYQEENARDYELTKTVSLVQLDPVALIALKETGTCTITLPEELFDMDHPGQYMRRIKSVSVSVPCVAGPYTGVQGRLTLLSSAIRASKSAASPYKRQADDPRFLLDFSAVQSIAFSHAQNDAGLFELSFRDERYLPFEGAGAISEWRLELPKETNAFDTDTIPDILLHIGYTAREGGEALRQAAYASAVFEPAQAQPAGGLNLPKAPGQPALRRLVSLRHEYAAEWHRFLYPEPNEVSQRLDVKLDAARFPYRYRGRTIKVNGIKCYLKLKEGVVYPGNGSLLEMTVGVPVAGTTYSAALVPDAAVLNGLPGASYDVSAEGRGFGDWVLEASESSIAGLPDSMRVVVNGRPRLRPEAIADLLMLLEYSVG